MSPPPSPESRGAAIRRLLFSPRPSHVDPANKLTAELFAGAVLCLAVVFGSYDSFTWATVEGYQPPWQGYVLMLVSYTLVRLGHLTAAASVAVAMVPLVAFGLVVTGRSASPLASLSFPVIAVMLATLLLGVRGTIAIAGISSALVVIAPLAVPQYVPTFGEVSGALVLNMIGGAVGVLSILHRNRLEADRRQALESVNSELERRVAERTAELERANTELEAFSYTVSHDLRAPLRAVDGFSAMLEEDFGGALGPEGLEHLHVIRQSGERMAQLIEGLLMLSRVSRAPLDRRPVDLAPMAKEIIEGLQREHPTRAVAFECPPSLEVAGDARLLRALLENLLGNAWKFTAKTPDARIVLERVERQGQPFCCVRDNGAGFDMQHVAKLFRPFERLHRDEDFAGTGIGLATVQRIVARHGGRIFAESTLGQGAAFWFSV